MKEKKALIKIGYSCDANWQKMSPTEQGKFCHSCNKEVVDFTHFSDKRLIDYLENKKTSICGKVNNHQLNRTLISPVTYRLPQFSRIYKFLASIFFASIISRVEGQEPITKEPTEQQPVYEETTTLKRHFEYTTIKGKIIDTDTKEPVPFVKVFLTEDILRFGCVSDINGDFMLKIETRALSDTSSITLRSFDYLARKIPIDKTDMNELHILKIEEPIDLQANTQSYHTIGMIIMEDPRKSKRRARKERRNSGKEE